MRPNSRFAHVQPFDIDRVAAAAGADPDVLRMENLDTDVPPPPAAVEATVRSLQEGTGNSWLPFTGLPELCAAVADDLRERTGQDYDPLRQIAITSGGTSAVMPVLLATTEPGDPVVLTDPTYAGLLQRVRLSGARPHLVPLRVDGGHWRLDREALAEAGPAAALLLMSPSMPSGVVLDREDWELVARVCERTGAYLIYDAAMERIVFDGHPRVNPCQVDGLAERTIIIGSVSKEYRMIGWRIGWVAGPADIMSRIMVATIYNTTVASGFHQLGAAAALREPSGVAEAVAEYQARHETVAAQLDGLPLVRAGGGWSCLVDAEALGLTAADLSARLLDRGRVAATPMTAWGETVAPRYVRLVFSNEPVERLAELRARFDAALS
ncbi:Aspartate aminotransferase [[Actinomadura] parvosata subsp. kistnae]|uniref:Aspartate aminotransferase n=1 Tax=[Actinomadura] parvosata subsp. kistnae TaxID=1909395 RepID=A0A1V0AMJ0_9ACTN|nr:pyridoxal phosphate-dependent aminotransferase [Nonomuraea sp. ATCC 55076]AQZ71400.1 aspartate aminotransferase [Nonomuraea sp. ATCC 55076]SPL91577.1 Aspartate aminotransferase [Actinomadura parvosata subsp. kistnae]